MCFLRTGIWVFFTAAGFALIVLVGPELNRPVETARWFAPGPIGFEPATPSNETVAGTGSTQPLDPDFNPNPPAAQPRGFLTRGMSGVDAEWALRNAITPRLGFSHNLTNVFPPSLYDTHPEFFPLENGQRLRPPPGSGFWNPDIAREDAARFAAAAAQKYFDANPDTVSFALGVNDALIWGESEELKTLVAAGPGRSGWFRERPDYSNLVFTFMNRVAGELEKTHPEKYVGALAYYWAENVPDFPLHPQVIPFLTADRAQGYDPDARREELELQRKWAVVAGIRHSGPRMTDHGLRTRDQRPETTDERPETTDEGQRAGLPRRMGIYDYLYGNGFLVPRIHTALLAENLRHAYRVGFTDYYAEVYANWGLDGPMPWLAAQLIQDPEQSETALLDEYYRRYFREAAGPMRLFFERCEELWLAQPGPPYWLKHYRNQSQAVVFPVAAVRELRALLDEAGRQAWFGKTRARVRFVSDGFGVSERFLAFRAAQDRLTRMSLRPRATSEALAAVLAEYRGAKEEFVSYTNELQRTEPLAVRAFRWDDYLKDDPEPMAEYALAARTASVEAEGARRAGTGGAVRPGRELLRNAEMSGPLVPARMIAGLTYGVAVPAEWQGRVEPSQFHRGELIEVDGGRVLRISGTKDTTVSQWVWLGSEGPGKDGGAEGRGTAGAGAERREVGPTQRAAMMLRGKVSPGTAVSLVFSWLDANHRHVGFRAVRLPDGEWPEWVTLRQAGEPPAGAAWVGLGLRVQNQVGGDWVEAKGFSVEQ